MLKGGRTAGTNMDAKPDRTDALCRLLPTMIQRLVSSPKCTEKKQLKDAYIYVTRTILIMFFVLFVFVCARE